MPVCPLFINRKAIKTIEASMIRIKWSLRHLAILVNSNMDMVLELVVISRIITTIGDTKGINNSNNSMEVIICLVREAIVITLMMIEIIIKIRDLNQITIKVVIKTIKIKVGIINLNTIKVIQTITTTITKITNSNNNNKSITT